MDSRQVFSRCVVAFKRCAIRYFMGTWVRCLTGLTRLMSGFLVIAFYLTLKEDGGARSWFSDATRRRPIQLAHYRVLRSQLKNSILTGLRVSPLTDRVVQNTCYVWGSTRNVILIYQLLKMCVNQGRSLVVLDPTLNQLSSKIYGSVVMTNGRIEPFFNITAKPR